MFYKKITPLLYARLEEHSLTCFIPKTRTSDGFIVIELMPETYHRLMTIDPDLDKALNLLLESKTTRH